MKTDLKKLDNSEIEITVELPETDFMAYWPKAIKTLTPEVKIDGFRPGKAPEKIVIDHVGEDKILVEMADLAIRDLYSQIIKEHKLDPIGQPTVSLTKLAKNNPLGFTLKTAVMPTITLPDYKKIAKTIIDKDTTKIEVTDLEVDQVIKEIQKEKAEKPKQPDEKLVLPELTDDWVKTFGDFKSVTDFKAKIKENLLAEKKHKATEKRHLEIMAEIGKQANLDLPPILIEQEKHRMLAELQNQIEQMGLKFDDYLKHLKKTEEELKTGFTSDAQKRVEFGLLIQTIAEQEKLYPEAKEIEAEVQVVKNKLPDGDKVEPERIKAYVKNVLTTNKVLNFLDPQS